MVTVIFAVNIPLSPSRKIRSAKDGRGIYGVSCKNAPRGVRYFFLVNRVEHEKLDQTTAELPFVRVFVVQLGLRQMQALFNTTSDFTISSTLLNDGEQLVLISRYLFLPTAELNTKSWNKLVFNSIH